MNTYLKKIVKSLMISAAAVVFLTVSDGVARADEVNFTGLAGGGVCLVASQCAPSQVGPTQTAFFLGLHYHGSSFDVTTAGGFAGVGNTANPLNNS